MNITDKDGKWRLTDGMILNRKTNEIRYISNMPNHQTIAHMPYKTYMKKVAIAFNTGIWPD